MDSAETMAQKAQDRAEGTDSGDATVRASISFPRELYETLEEMARQKKVSLAWVVRDAAEQYVAEKWPLFKGQV
jgi:predicted DNA-binding ribbon-helix-helix protein